MDKKTVQFDWEKGDFVHGNGVVQTVTKEAAILEIVKKALQTTRAKALIYADIENADLHHKYGNDVPYILKADIDDATKLSELETAVAEALKYDSWIKKVDSVTVTRTGTDSATADIELTTIYDTKINMEGVSISD